MEHLTSDHIQALKEIAFAVIQVLGPVISMMVGAWLQSQRRRRPAPIPLRRGGGRRGR